MITGVHLRNFKSFLNENISFAPLTILAGVNASGKSSLIQAICLAHDTSEAQNNSWLDKWTQLGKYKSRLSIETSYSICVMDNNGKVDFQVTNITAEGFRTSLRNTSTIDKPGIVSFVSADRLGPRNQLPAKNQNDVFSVGETGENVITLIDKYMYHQSPEKLSGKQINNNYLDRINEWLELIAQDNKLTYTKDTVRNMYFPVYNGILPTETGYGLSYTLPVIAELLLFDQPNKTLLLENPEAHLHPKAQSSMGELIAIAASCGKQIVLETHSDHIINGIRLAVKNGVLDHKEAKLLFFDKHDGFESYTRITDIHLDRQGELDHYPIGLLDEWGELMSQLF